MTAAALSFLCLFSTATLPPAAATRSGSIVWLQDGTTLAVANLDSNTITLVGTDPFVKLDEVTVGRHPRSLAASHDGRWLFVSLAETDRVVRVDLSQRRRAGSLRVSGGPFAMVAHPQAGKLYVAAAHADVVVEIDIPSGQIARRLSVAAAPRGMSISSDGQRLYVVDFFSGTLTIVDTASFEVVSRIANRPDANLARSIAITPDGRVAYLPHIRSHVTNRRLQFDTTVFPVVSRLDLVEQLPDHTGLIALDAIGRPANNPWDAVVSQDGRRLYVVNSGSNDVQVIDLQSGRSVAQTDVGSNPRGIVLSADGRRAYVHNALSNDISRIGTASLTELRRLKLTRDRLPETIQRGKTFFHSARSRSMTLDRWISCASCHPDGESDGRTWQFAAGPRKTPSLHGAALTLPHNRSADRDELQDTEHFIRHLMGGTGLLPGSDPPAKLGPPSAGRSKDADALAAYIASLQPRRSPFASETPQRRNAIARGREIFFSQRTSCARCHPPPLYTDSRLSPEPWRTHDVGTGGGPNERAGPNYDTPSLLGLFAARSYLHDGRAKTLAEVFTIHNANDRHGTTSHLNDAQIDDLVAYLLSLPAGHEKVTRN
jgi:YVTN family beta-propeller protein